MSFREGFEKVGGIGAGLKAAGNQTVKEVITLKGLRDAVHGIRDSYKGKMKNLFKTKEGLSDLGEALAKSTPSLAVGTLYAAAAKRSYDVTKRDSQNQYDNYYQ